MASQQQQPPPTLEYSAENAGNYWMDRWTKGNTPWQNDERAAGTAAYARHLGALLHQEDPASLVHDSATTPRPHLLVPLCGDTPLMAFAWQKLGWNVTGIEFDINAAKKAFAEAGAESSSVKVRVVDDTVTPPRVELTSSAAGAEGSAPVWRILVGDLFAWGNDEKELSSDCFDVAYDRGSLVALLPEQRAAYLSIMQRVLKTSLSKRHVKLFVKLPPSVASAVCFRTIHRKAGDAQGPPFHIDADVLSTLYNKDAQFEIAPSDVPSLDGQPRPFLEGQSNIYRAGKNGN